MKTVTATSCFVLPFLLISSGHLWMLPTFLNANKSFMIQQSTVSKDKGPIALRFYTGKTLTEYNEYKITDGISILNSSAFEPKNKTIVVFPGYHQNADSYCTEIITDEGPDENPLRRCESQSFTSESISLTPDSFLKLGSVNVVMVDWSTFSTAGYFKSLYGCALAGLQFAALLKKMGEYGVPLSLFHLMGHSLGAHCSGYVGKQFANPKLSRITGIDPAGPLFNFDPFKWTRLTADDADFVDVIHTSRAEYGILQACGTADFYLNCNGFRFQPGCPFTFKYLSFDKKVTCSHIMAARYYAESVLNPSAFLAVNCPSFITFMEGDCSNKPPVIMGYKANISARGSYYLTTNEQSPYGKGLEGTNPGKLNWCLY